jgi:hypothetical protein
MNNNGGQNMEVGNIEFGPSAETYYHGREEQMMSIPKTTVLTTGGHPRFNELLIELSELHARKNSDYSGDNPLANLKECENYGVPAWKGVLIRLSDKYSRIRSIVKKGSISVKDESLIDTLRDQAVYSLLAIILMEEDNIDTPTAEKKC